MLTACDTMQRMFATNPDASGISGLEARVAPINGSAATGSVRFVARADGSTMLVQIDGLSPGRYRLLVHAIGNCTSPNGFSAGPPWSPEGSSKPLYDRLPVLTANSAGNASMTVRLPDVSMQALLGKSVVLHDSIDGPFTAEPGARNDRIGCGVLGPMHTLL
jgi:Cu-Zn family superoxide dismutase